MDLHVLAKDKADAKQSLEAALARLKNARTKLKAAEKEFRTANIAMAKADARYIVAQSMAQDREEK